MIEGEGMIPFGMSGGTGEMKDFQYSWVVCDVCGKRDRIDSYVAFVTPNLPAGWFQLFTPVPWLPKHYCSVACAATGQKPDGKT